MLTAVVLALAHLTATPRPTAGQWPVQPATIVRGFDPPDVAWTAGHRGVDLAASTGQEVRSMSAGTVSFVGTVAGIPVVSVSYGGRLRSTYEPVLASVRQGQAVGVGDMLGTVAVRGGHCGGQAGCVHVGLRTDARYFDPTILVEPIPAILKPQR